MLWIPHQFSWEVTCRVDVSMLNLSIYPFLANCFFIVLAMLLLAWASIYVVPLWLVFCNAPSAGDKGGLKAYTEKPCSVGVCLACVGPTGQGRQGRVITRAV